MIYKEGGEPSSAEEQPIDIHEAETEDPKAEAETLDPLDRFRGQDMEVTVGRKKDKKTGKYAYMEGGWEVVRNADAGPGKVVVRNHKDGLEKTFKIQELLSFQPFQAREKVPVIRSNGKLDLEGWAILKSFGDGTYVVISGSIDGEHKIKTLSKLGTPERPGLIEAKIAELQLRKKLLDGWEDPSREGRAAIDDQRIREKIDKEINYWQEKKDVTERLSQESLAEAA